jgi:hypothetical protein
MLPCSLGHLGVRAGEVCLGELEIEHRLTLGLVFRVDDLPAFFPGSLPQAGAFSPLGIHAIEDSVAASAANEAIACFHAVDAIPNVNEPASEALASSKRAGSCTRKVLRGILVSIWCPFSALPLRNTLPHLQL